MEKIVTYDDLKQYWWVYSKSLANYLQANGLKVLEVREDAKYQDKGYLNWKFENTDRLHTLIDMYDADRIMKTKGLY